MAVNYDTLLEEYRLLWNNRLLSAGGQSSEDILKEAIKRELLDENSHPRIRKNKYEKYYSAVSRIVKSSIPQEVKITLIEIHNDLLDQLI